MCRVGASQEPFEPPRAAFWSSDVDLAVTLCNVFCVGYIVRQGREVVGLPLQKPVGVCGHLTGIAPFFLQPSRGGLGRAEYGLDRPSSTRDPDHTTLLDRVSVMVQVSRRKDIGVTSNVYVEYFFYPP